MAKTRACLTMQAHDLQFNMLLQIRSPGVPAGVSVDNES
jgi:hypothetical protein